MKYHCKKKLSPALVGCRAFTLIETVAALVILAIISFGVLVVLGRCMSSASDTSLRMHAFEVARENMEKILAMSIVPETVEYGQSEMYPAIEWEKRVEVFFEPVKSHGWVRALSSAEYADSKDERQKVVLTHWLTDLTKAQLEQIRKEREKAKELLAERVIYRIEEAAMYVGVDTTTVEEWVDKGMPLSDDGGYIKDYLDLYLDYGGQPPAELMKEVAMIYENLKLGRTEPISQLDQPGEFDVEPLEGEQGAEGESPAEEQQPEDVPSEEKTKVKSLGERK
ncbi:MAG: type IV pilus modification PilV family protein [Planctomycetota bacterium]|jgi:prepilin-type N-terminal cleavage/methylation domain-containing protein